jgi:hypothetical protein
LSKDLAKNKQALINNYYTLIGYYNETKNYENAVLEENIKISTLDKFQLSPDFIKIDTQGFELFILKGAKNTLKNKTVLLLECEKKQQKQQIIEYLTPLGYAIVETVKKDSIWVVK